MWLDQSLIIVHDVEQHIGACAAFQDLAAGYVDFKDVALPN